MTPAAKECHASNPNLLKILIKTDEYYYYINECSREGECYYVN